MSLYLSRLCLNPLYAPALSLAADPYELHRTLLDTLPCEAKPKPATAAQPKTADLLFRVDASDAGPVVLLQTAAPPDWGALRLTQRELRLPPQTKPHAPALAAGQRLGFRILCQPSIRKSGTFGVKPNGKRLPGPRRTCRTEEERLHWLKRRAEAAGFMIETVGSTFVEWRNTKRLQARGGAPVETREQARDRALGPGVAQTLGGVRFDGTLVVVDADKLWQAVREGVGPQKAFGFGLVSVAPAP